MPKETINNRFPDGPIKTLTSHGTTEEYQTWPFLTVNWSRDCGVSIAALEGGDVDEGVRNRDGYHVELDRAGINRLIRTLRRARDAAFGADA